jgi:hypothetical protein
VLGGYIRQYVGAEVGVTGPARGKQRQPEQRHGASCALLSKAAQAVRCANAPTAACNRRLTE